MITVKLCPFFGCFTCFSSFQLECSSWLRSMFDFKRLLKLIYRVTKLSGFVFISIEFETTARLKIKKDFWNILIFALSFGLSLYSLTYDGRFAVMDVTHSKIMEIIINLMIDLMIFSPCFIKPVNACMSLKFFKIYSYLHWSELKVRRVRLFANQFY